MSDNKYPTPHINARPDDIAKVILMPGDPLRAKHIAESFLDNTTLFNNVRGVNGYTGYWNGKRVSVMASGMGMPSMGIYSYELFNFFDVDCILRVGSAGAISESAELRSIVLGMGACTDSAYFNNFGISGSFAPICDYTLLKRAAELAEARGAKFSVGNLLSSDCFYKENIEDTLAWGKMGVLAVEMEAAALYMNAARAGKRALAICTVSDSLVTGEATDSAERQSGFNEMIRLALDLAADIQG